MFIDPTMNPRPALQRSAMFLPMARDTALRFAPPGARRIFWSFRFINIRPYGTRKCMRPNGHVMVPVLTACDGKYYARFLQP